MPNGTPFTTRFIETFPNTCCIGQGSLSSPVQTVSGGTNWSDLDIISISTSLTHSGAIKVDGTLWLWGSNTGGKLGDNTTISRSSPVQTISSGIDWYQVSLSAGHSASIKTDGTLWLWGFGNNGRLGTNNTTNRSSPVQTVSAGTNWKQVSLGYAHSGAIKTDGTLWLWGDQGAGKLGDNTTISRSSPVQTISTGNNWKQLSLGGTHSAAIKTDGTLWLWGCAAEGQLGNFDNGPGAARSSPVQTVSTGTNWKQVSLGSGQTAEGNQFSAAVKTDGTLWLWGNNDRGQLGDNTINQTPSPIQTISTGTNWKQVSAGDCHSAAVKTDGTLWLWGGNATAELGDNTRTNRSSPVQTVSTGANWKQVASGISSSMSTKVDGTLWMWGENLCGKLGDNTTTNRSSPVQTVSTGTNWTEECAWYEFSGGNCHSAAIKSDGTLWLWGYGTSGQLGNNLITNRSSPVQTVSTGTNWKQVSLGAYHSASIKTDGTLWLWGFNIIGQLGDNTPSIDSSSPVQTVSTGTDWKEVSLGYCHSAAIKTDGTLWLWGCNGYGRLGTGNTTSRSSPVQTVSTGNNWKQVSLGAFHSASIKTDGTLWLWGLNDEGQLGNNNLINRSSPVQTITTGTNWKQLSLGFEHSAAIKTDGTLWLWGWNFRGQLGNNAGIDQSSPVQTVSTGNNWKQVSIKGIVHSAAVKTDGTLWLWGENGQGQLGINVTIRQSSPVQTVSTGTSWKQVSLGGYHTLALTNDERLYVWGCNVRGQVGCDPLLQIGEPFTTDLGNVLFEKEYLLDLYPNLIPSMKAPGLWLNGRNGAGQLGDNSTTPKSSPVQTISAGTNWARVSSGYVSAGIKSDGTLWLWGNNTAGRLGNNNTINRSSPVQTVSTGTNWEDVSVGFKHHTASIKTDGTLWVWGCNAGGILGNNTTINRSSPVQTVSTGTNWKQVCAGENHTLALKTDGTLWTWGTNSDGGPLGNNTTINRSSPVQTVSNVTNWRQVSSGVAFSAATKIDGTLWLWGSATGGKLGNNVTINQSSPVQTVSSGTNWKQVSIGGLHAAAIKTDGTLWLWGCNAVGVLGDNSSLNQSSPVQTISFGTNWKILSSGNNHVASIKTDGTLWLWGDNIDGQLLTNDAVDRSSPTQTITGGTDWKQVSAGSYVTINTREEGDW